MMIDEMSRAKGRPTSCAIVAPVPDVDAFRAEATKALRLPKVPEPELRADGSRSYVWEGYISPLSTIIVRDFAPTGRPGVMVKRLEMVPAGR
ncbi:hypothetical protein ABLE93_24865 [Xanthobacter sp. KR7-65]|uniref:hypothetical protein n=1 Tax=Xanthobacter sp. KR7-65 TaxID=3156612 RepID=UPI0032B4F32B